jgi:hypothetical protein
MAEVLRIKVQSVLTDVAYGDNKPGDFAEVTFRLTMQDYNMDIPVYVNLGRVEDADVVRAARHEFVTTLESVLGLTNDWKQEKFVVKKREVELKEL